MHPKHRGVALLLSLGTLPIGLAGCNKDDDENTHIGTQVTSDGDSTDAPPTSTSTGEPDTTATSSITSTSSSTTASDPTTGEFTTDEFTTGEPPGPTTGDPPPPATNEACILYGERVGMCPGYDAAEAASSCQQIIDDGEQLDGQACRETMEALYVCLTKQDCADIPTATGCGEEFNEIVSDCPMFYYG